MHVNTHTRSTRIIIITNLWSLHAHKAFYLSYLSVFLQDMSCHSIFLYLSNSRSLVYMTLKGNLKGNCHAQAAQVQCPLFQTSKRWQPYQPVLIPDLTNISAHAALIMLVMVEGKTQNRVGWWRWKVHTDQREHCRNTMLVWQHIRCCLGVIPRLMINQVESETSFSPVTLFQTADWLTMRAKILH